MLYSDVSSPKLNATVINAEHFHRSGKYRRHTKVDVEIHLPNGRSMIRDDVELSHSSVTKYYPGDKVTGKWDGIHHQTFKGAVEWIDYVVETIMFILGSVMAIIYSMLVYKLVIDKFNKLREKS